MHGPGSPEFDAAAVARARRAGGGPAGRARRAAARDRRPRPGRRRPRARRLPGRAVAGLAARCSRQRPAGSARDVFLHTRRPARSPPGWPSASATARRCGWSPTSSPTACSATSASGCARGWPTSACSPRRAGRRGCARPRASRSVPRPPRRPAPRRGRHLGRGARARLLVDHEHRRGPQPLDLGRAHHVGVLLVEELEAVVGVGRLAGELAVLGDFLPAASPKPSTLRTVASPSRGLSRCSSTMSSVNWWITNSFSGRSWRSTSWASQARWR